MFFFKKKKAETIKEETVKEMKAYPPCSDGRLSEHRGKSRAGVKAYHSCRLYAENEKRN